MNAHIEEHRREIVFSLKDGLDPRLLMSQVAAEIEWSEVASSERPDDGIVRVFESWCRGIDIRRQDTERIPTPEIPSPVAEVVLAWARSSIFCGISDLEDVGGFLLGDFRKFYAGMYAYARCITMLEERCDVLYGEVNDLGSLVFHDSDDLVIGFMAEITGVRTDTIRRIVALLSFDEHSLRSSIDTQPFVRTHCGSLSLLVRLIAIVDPHRMLAGSLKRRSGEVYDRLIDSMENVEVGELASLFRRHGLRAIEKKRILAPDRSQVCPDLIVLEEATGQLLVVEYKHALPPVGPAEVSNKLKEAEKWIKQARKYKNFVQRFPDAVRSAVGASAEPSTVEAIVVFRWPMPVPLSQPSDVLVTSRDIVSRLLWEHNESQVSTIVSSLRFDGTHIESSPWKPVYVRTHVGDWTYVRPVIAESV
ncbi:hypothetical protein [Polyangium sp. y55x31]|uniref:hypothetical protein n=1 Tax=Polyangium sp. y55x31 TaxID=3042688 RepID=UPI002482F234|nr:hypothetical protein [Polyangium sp. y55x31]MDI1483610.1 hypothetical protein [Polyangium sp. y55x31]